MAEAWPEIPKGKRVTGDERAALSAKAKAMYDDGQSIRDIAAASGRSIGFARSLLVDAGVTFRPRGGPTRAAKS
jgi:hypothetical protein